jgi:hypothetical protein
LGASRSLMYKFTELKKSVPKLNDSGGKLLNDGNQKYKYSVFKSKFFE